MSIMMILLGLIATAASVGATPTCDAEGLTRSCGVFEESKTKQSIEYPDKTFIPNPLFAESRASSAAEKQNLLRAKVQLLRVWEVLPEGSRPPAAFQLAFSQALFHPALQAAFALAKGSSSHGQDPLLLPWPPGRSDAEVTVVSTKQLREYIDELPEGARKKLVQAVEEASKEIAGRPRPAQVGPDPATRAARISELFGFAKNTLLDEILQGRRYEGLSPEERSQYDRVKLLVLASQEETEMEPSCAKMAPDAFYSWESHRVYICPGMYHMPDSALIEVLGHEIAHPIDPCSLQIPLLRVNRTKLAALKQQPQKWANPEAEMLLSSLDYGSSSDLAVFSGIMSSQRKDALTFLQTAGVAEVVATGVPFDKYPSKGAYRCLVDKVGIREVAVADLEKIAKAYLRDRHGRWGADAGRDLERSVKRALNRFPQCIAPNTSKSQVSEAMSDVWSAKVLARWVAANQPKNEIERLAPMAMFLTSYCKADRSSKPSSPSVSEILDVGVEALSRAHPYSRERAEKIFLADAGLQKALGCRPVQKVSCSAELGHQRKSAPSRSNRGGEKGSAGHQRSAK